MRGVIGPASATREGDALCLSSIIVRVSPAGAADRRGAGLKMD